jgi:hypothetical protein
MQAQIFNSAYEALLVADGQIITLFEANGEELNPDPSAYQFTNSTLSDRSIDLTSVVTFGCQMCISLLNFGSIHPPSHFQGNSVRGIHIQAI